MRIAYVTESFPPDVNGVAHTAVRVAEHLLSRGHQPLVIAPELKLMSDLGMRSASMLELLLELEDNLDIQIDVEDCPDEDCAEATPHTQ